MMERMLLSKFSVEQVAVMSPLAFREEADLLRKEYTKVQAARREMPGLATASDGEIDRYVLQKLRKIQAEGFDMPGLATASDGEIDRYVLQKLRKSQAEGFDMPGLATASDGEIDRYVLQKLRKMQAEGFDMPGLATASDGEIDRYVTDKLRKSQAEGFGMPGLATASESGINHFVMENLRAITTDRLDALTDGLIQCLPLCHRLQNFRSDIPAWLAEIDNSVTAAQCNKFQRAEHILTKFGIHTEMTHAAYRTKLNQS